MILLDKLSQKNIQRDKDIQKTNNNIQNESPLPNIAETIKRPPAAKLESRIESMPQTRDNSQSQSGQRVIDLPANVQIEGIQSIISGQLTGNQIIDNFVNGMVSQGKSPEEIRTAFIEQQKKSPNPIIL